MYGNNQYALNSLERLRDRINDTINNYQAVPQQAPVNNFINTNNVPANMYEVKKLNEKDEVENIAVFKDTIFIGEDRMQIKKLDGTVEKYDIKKTYPRDKKDDKIDELNKKIEELEERLNEPKSSISVGESVKESSQQGETTIINDKPTAKKSSARVPKSE